MCIRSFPKESGGKLLHMNVNLDSTKIIMTGHIIVASFFLRLFYYQLAGLQSN